MNGLEIEPEVSEVSEPELSEEELTEQRLMGEELKRLRETRRLTRAELAEQMGGGFTEALIARYETGDAPMEAIHVFALMKTLRASQESVEPNRLMAARLLQSGYGGLSQEALAELMGKNYSRKLIWLYETGGDHMPIGALFSICDILGLNLEETVGDTSQEQIEKKRYAKRDLKKSF